MIAISKIEISQIFDSLQETIHSEFKSLKFSIQICRIQNFPILIFYYTFIKKKEEEKCI